MFVPAVAVLGSVAFVVLVLQLPRGLGFHDEAWYLMVIRDKVSENGGAWNMLLRFLPDSLILWRTLSLLIRIVTCPLLCFGFLILCDATPTIRARMWIPLSITAVLAADADPVLAAAYYNLNFLCFSVSFALAAFAGTKFGTVSMVASTLAGVFAFFLFPVLPTVFPSCTVILLAVLWLTSLKRGWRVAKIGFFALGIVFGSVVFFGLCESPSEYFAMARTVAVRAATGAGGHSVKGFVKWIVQSARTVGFGVLLPAAALATALRANGKRAGDIASIAVFVSVAVGLLVGEIGSSFQLLNSRLIPAFPPHFPWIAACFLVLFVPSRRRPADVAAILFLILVPISLSFGSAVSLTARGRAYLWPLVAAALLRDEALAPIRIQIRLRGAVLLLLVCSTIFSLGQHFGSWILVEKSYFAPKIKDPDTGLLLPAPIVDNLRQMRTVGIDHACIQPFDRYCWGYVWALGGYPLSRTFECEGTQLKELLKRDTPSVVYLLSTSGEANKVERMASEIPGFLLSPIMNFTDGKGSHRIFALRKNDVNGDIEP